MVEHKDNIVGFIAAYYWSSTTYFVIMLDRSQLFEGSAFVSGMFFAGFTCHIDLLLLKETRDTTL